MVYLFSTSTAPCLPPQRPLPVVRQPLAEPLWRSPTKKRFHSIYGCIWCPAGSDLCESLWWTSHCDRSSAFSLILACSLSLSLSLSLSPSLSLSLSPSPSRTPHRPGTGMAKNLGETAKSIWLAKRALHLALIDGTYSPYELKRLKKIIRNEIKRDELGQTDWTVIADWTSRSHCTQLRLRVHSNLPPKTVIAAPEKPALRPDLKQKKKQKKRRRSSAREVVGGKRRSNRTKGWDYFFNRTCN